MSERLKTWEQARVPVYDQSGKLITTISKACTSIGAAKAANAKACEWSLRFKPAGWIVKA